MSLESRRAEAENDLQAAKTKYTTGMAIGAGGGLGMFASVAAMDAAETSGEGVGVWFLFMFIALAICLSGLSYSGDNGKEAQKKIDRLKGERQGNKRKLEQKDRDLKEAKRLMDKGGIENLTRAMGIFKKCLKIESGREEVKKTIIEAKTKLAGELEDLLRYKEAIDIWEELGKHSEAKRVRKKIREDGRVKVDQTVVHGDYVDDRDTTYIDDRDTIIKDSVVSKSSIGAGGDDKVAKLEKIANLKREGLIDDAEFKQMKKEILGK